MQPSDRLILLAGLLMLVSVITTRLSRRIGMPILLVFLGFGMLAGEDGPGGLAWSDVPTSHFIGSLALAVILFDGGMRTQLKSFRVGLRPALGLATLGVLFSAAITGLFAAWALGFDYVEGLLIGAIVGSTDASAVFGVLHAHGLRLKERVGATLEIESGLNDPMAIFLTVAVLEWLLAGRPALDAAPLLLFAQQMGVGAVLGLAGGYLVWLLLDRLDLGAVFTPLFAFAAGLALYGTTAFFGGSGFLAVYLGGLVIGNRPSVGLSLVLRLHEGLAWLAQIAMFLILGLLVTPSQIVPVAWPALLVGLGLMFAARPLAVWLCLLPFRFSPGERLFIAWVGLRGAVPIVLAMFPLLADLPHAGTMFNVAFVVVLLSLSVQGWTVAPLARRLGLELPPAVTPQRHVVSELPGTPGAVFASYVVAVNAPVAGGVLGTLGLPPASRPVAVARGGRLLAEPASVRLVAGDAVHLLAPPGDLEVLDRQFGGRPQRPGPAERAFFGEWVLNGDANLEALAGLYGLQLAADERTLTVGALLTRAFRKPVVGDRLRRGRLEIVVRELDGDRVLHVGLKLHRNAETVTG